MTINDLVEGAIEGLTMDNFNKPQIQVKTIEVSVPKIPMWVKLLFVVGIILLVIFIVMDLIKTAEIRKSFAESERLKLLNEKNIAAKIAAEDKLGYYGLK